MRGGLDRYVASLDVPSAAYDRWPRERRMAFWLNAYNAFVLKTVIDNYPIAQRTSTYPAHSIRQIPGAFERTPHRAAGRTVTLDQIEQTILSGFRDPRLYFALGRGAMGGGRLRSEAFAAGMLERQLSEVAAECINRSQCLELDRAANQLTISSIFSWRSGDFIASYASGAPETFATRSPIERALLAFVQPKLLASERDFLAKNEFKVAYRPFDWSLNDLTGGRRGR
jgi:hypothetical protein